MARLLITGGAGFIGSHTCVVLLEAGHELVVLDSFANSSPVALERVSELAGRPVQLVEGDVRNAALLDQLFADANASGQRIDAVIHFAGLKAVGESVTEPLRYWDVNLCGSRTLLAAMDSHGCRTLVFSSSATLYGYPETVPISEAAPIKPINPYGHSKAAVEQLLRDVVASAPDQWSIASLRYFNPVGAHPSGRMGEDPNGIPNNLFPFVSQVAIGRRNQLQVFGGDWPTHDGTGVRDYIHVVDLAEGHVAALDALDGSLQGACTAVNLGTGVGSSVLEVISAASDAVGAPIAHEIVDRRPGDIEQIYADPAYAKDVLGWEATRDLATMMRDHWNWQRSNPDGFRD